MSIEHAGRYPEKDPHRKPNRETKESYFINLSGAVGRVALGRDNTFMFRFRGANQAKFDHVAVIYSDPENGLDQQAVLFECPELMEDLTKLGGYNLMLMDYAPPVTQNLFIEYQMQRFEEIVADTQ